MTQEGRLPGYPYRAQFLAPVVYVDNRFGYIFDVALGIDASRNGKTYKLHVCRYEVTMPVIFAEHYRAYLD